MSARTNPTAQKERTHAPKSNVPGVITAGIEPHAAGIVCADCGRHCGWLSRATVSKLHEIIERFGMPSEPLIVRNQSSHFCM